MSHFRKSIREFFIVALVGPRLLLNANNYFRLIFAFAIRSVLLWRYMFNSCKTSFTSGFTFISDSKVRSFTTILAKCSNCMVEQPWPSGKALDSGQRCPGFEAHCRPLVTSGRASGRKCSCQN